jgi:hypothetical protein
MIKFSDIEKWIKENNIPILTKNRAEKVNHYAEKFPITYEEYCELIEIEYPDGKDICVFCHQKTKNPLCCDVFLHLKINRFQIYAWMSEIRSLVEKTEPPNHYLRKKEIIFEKKFPGFYMGNGSWKFLDYLPKFDEKGICYEEKWDGEWSMGIDEFEDD